MRPSLIIPRIKAECPIFAGRVAGSATMRRVFEQTDFPVPHAFVVTLGEEPSGDVTLSDLDQELTRRFSVTVAVDNTSDERGQAASEVLEDCRNQLLAALVGWSPDPERYGAVFYAGMPYDIDISRARAWAQLDWQLTAYTADAG